MHARKMVNVKGKQVVVYAVLHGRPNWPKYRPNHYLGGGNVVLPFVTAGVTINEPRPR